MPVADLKIMVEDLEKIVITFSSNYTEFKESTFMNDEDAYNKFMDGICRCHGALATIMGTWEVESIRKRVK